MTTPPSIPPVRDADTEVDESGVHVGSPAAAEMLAPEEPPVVRIRSGRLAGLGLWPSIFVLSWPILIDSLMNWLVGAVDTVLAAGLSESAADAIGGAAYVAWFMGMIGMSLGVGATALVSRSVGRGRRAVADAGVGQTMIIAVALGAAVGLLVWASAPVLASLLHLSDEASEALVGYLRILGLAVPMITIMESGVACCRGAGDSLRPLLIMILVNAVNVVVSWSLAGVDLTRTTLLEDGTTVTRMVYENPFSFDMGVTGVALGTLIAWTTGAMAVVALLASGRTGLRLRAKRLRPHWHTMRRVLRVGLPNFLETLGMWLGNFVVIMMVGWMAQPGLLGAHIVAIRIEAISFLPGFAMAMASATLVGQWLGAGSAQMAAKAVWACVAIASAFMGLMGLVLAIFPLQVAGLFTPQASHLEVVPTLLLICGVVQVPFAMGMVLRSALRGAGDALVVTWITWFSTWGVRLPLAFFLSGVDPVIMGRTFENPSPVDWGLTGIWLGLCLELVVRGALFTGRWMQGTWKTQRV